MKNKRVIISMLAIVMFVAAGCDRDKSAFTGDYSYKLSGEVAITGEDGEVTYHLIHRNGQMNILKNKSQKGKYIITMNEMNGSGYVVSAVLQGDTLVIEPHEFTTSLITSDGISLIDEDNTATIVYRVNAAGSGRKTDNILIMREHWQGQQSGNPVVRLYAPEITIIAERN
ncbi:MAG: hypothetical protein J6X51_05445 [Bacteroidales bacterium]|nr:hypothetical protein [Bacteroidales bacterium]